MRFTTAFVACGLAVAATAQSTTADAPSSTVSIDPTQSSAVACLDDCDDDDLVCLARCNPVPNPNKDQVKATHECVTKCDQGDGSASDTKKYGDCVAVCIKENYYDSEEGTPDPNGGGSGNSSGNDDKDSNDDDKDSNDDGKDSNDDGKDSNDDGKDSNDDGKDSNDDGKDSNDDDNEDGSSESSASGTGASPTQSGSGDEASGTATEGAASETSDEGDAATGLVASSAALFGAIVAVLAL